jgi:extradiol dioxygenase family protein
MSLRPFHLAFPVKDLEATRKFYVNLLGCKVGRSAPSWIDFDMYGHQLSAHLAPNEPSYADTNPVDGKNVPSRHWGLILTMSDWEALVKRLKKEKVEFIIAPYIRFKGEVGEQATMFLLDPSGNVLEFKAFKDDAEIFRTS